MQIRVSSCTLRCDKIQVVYSREFHHWPSDECNAFSGLNDTTCRRQHHLIIPTDYHVALIETHGGRVVMSSLTRTKTKAADSEVVLFNHSQRENLCRKL